MRSLKYLLLPFILFYGVKVAAQVEQDGPYIVRSGKNIIAHYVLNDLSKTDTLNEKNPVQVRFAKHKEWDFSFKLRAKNVIQPSSYKAVEKMLVLSDIEGEFEAFRALMIANKVIDEKYNWIFGKGHLVICGDLFDRGKDVVPYLWLLYKLEEDAIKKGGFVHVLLGNHDVMNMAGDLRYLAPKYPASAKLIGITYEKLIAEDTEIGKWLRSKNAIEKIGDKLFLHAGISPEINATNLSLKEINDKCRSYYGISTKKLDAEGKKWMSSGGPFWYRGYFGDDRTPITTVDSTLAKFDVRQIVVGHTITEENIAAYYGDKVIGVDVNQHKGNRKAIIFNSEKAFVVDDKGNRTPLANSDKK
ncbi:metallophosphoesterase [Pedobacter sp. G11]|uniref:metallophosphoesterase n=1 Tax=Pedobacter sp. G11 TaxID=2482728 RepID=UPI000F5FC735|nr:metallophosphoesterase [Pedobacter sp. G11]AZI27426.1 metallophosphoesterase [Pedobacter sp. G11]